MATGYQVPEPIVEVAFSTNPAAPFRPWNLPDEVDWVPLVHADGSTRLLDEQHQRGRSDQFDQFDPGTATFVMDDNDRMLDENFDGSLVYGYKGGALTPIRFRVHNHYTDVTSTIFSGYITHGWEPSSSATRDRTVTVRAVEWLGWAATREIPRSLIASMIAAGFPDVWWRGDLSRGRINSANGGVAYDFSLSGSYDGTEHLGGNVEVAAPLVDDRENPGMRWHKGSSLRTPTSLPTTASDFGFFCAFQVVALDGVGRDLAVGRTGSISGNRRWRVRIGSNGHVAVEVFDAAGVSIELRTIDDILGAPIAFNDGEPHYVCAMFSATRTSMLIFSDLTNPGGSLSYLPTGGTYVGPGGFIITSAGATDARVLVDEWAYFSNTVTLDNRGLHFDQDEGLDAWSQHNISTRLDEGIEPLGRLTLPDSFWRPYVTPDPLDGVGGYVPQENLGAAIQATGAALAGGAFGSRDGRVQVYGYGDLSDSWFTDVTANLSNYEHAVDPIRYVGEGRSGLLLDRVINEVRARGARLAFDQDSIDTYGRKVLEFDSLNTSEIVAYAASIVAERKDPTHELGALTINPVGSETATTWLLEECELARLVSYEELTADGHWLSRYGTVQIQSESWSWSNGLDWSVTLKLAGGSEYELEYLLTEDDDHILTEADGDIIVEG